MSSKVHRTLDARGALCPIPTVKTSLALEEMAPGQVLELLADDPVTQRDLPAWCRESGHRLIGSRNEGKTFRLTIQKNPRP